MIRLPHIFAGVLAMSLVVGGVVGGVARAQYRDDMPLDVGKPAPIPNPTIVDKPNAQIPLDLEFTEWNGTKVELSSIFNQNKPVLLSLVYFSCPQLCGLNQDHLIHAIQSGPRNLQLGRDYDVVIVSIDPDDTPALAATKRENYLKMIDLPAAQPGFIYLTGTEQNIRKLADTIGFGYSQNPPQATSGKFAHSTGYFICTPDGRLSQTIGGITLEPDQLHHSLVEASSGRIGGGMLYVALCCGAVYYDAATGTYKQNPYFYAGTATGVVTIIFVGLFLSLLFRGDAKRKAMDAAAAEAAQNAGPRTSDSQRTQD